MIDMFVSSLARNEYDERLRQAELERRFSRQPGEQPRIAATVLLRLSQWLIDTGEALKHRVELRPTLN
jgi:hypothetical protein